MNMQTDLAEIAQLIETCFAATLDIEGINFVQYLRKVNESLKRGILGDTSFPNMSGFVWQEKGQVIANCSLIPHSYQGKITYLIANVSVRDDFRKHGIARQLTEASIKWLKYKKQPYVWLQVREGNEIAYHLYQKLGFIEKYRRNSWMIEPNTITRNSQSQFIHRRRISDWQQQNLWLDETYPLDIRWCLGLNSRDFTPSLLNAMSSWMDDRQLEHFSFHSNDQLKAVCSWQPSARLCPPIWLAAPEVYDHLALEFLVPYVVEQLKINKQVQINYPADRATNAFNKMGYKLLHSLKWMKLVIT